MTLFRLLVIFTALLGALMALGCLTEFPTVPQTHEDMWIDVMVQNECKKLGLSVDVVYDPEDRFLWVDPVTGEDIFACMSAMVPRTVIVYPTCRGHMDLGSMRYYAQHECCHLYLGHKMLPWPPEHNTQIEVEANQCVHDMF